MRQKATTLSYVLKDSRQAFVLLLLSIRSPDSSAEPPDGGDIGDAFCRGGKTRCEDLLILFVSFIVVN